MSKNFDPNDYVREGVTLEDVKDIKETFDIIDKDHSGAIDIKELKRSIRNLGFDEKDTAIQRILRQVDTNKSGEIDFDEFLSVMFHIQGKTNTPKEEPKVKTIERRERKKVEKKPEQTTVRALRSRPKKAIEAPKRPDMDIQKYLDMGYTEEEIYEFKDVFDAFDPAATGTIKTKEFKEYVNVLKKDDDNTLNKIYEAIEQDKIESLTFDEFLTLIYYKVQKKPKKDEIEEVFEYYINTEGGDKITLEHLQKVCDIVEEPTSDDTLKEMIDRADDDKDTKVSFDEFYDLFTNKIQE